MPTKDTSQAGTEKTIVANPVNGFWLVAVNVVLCGGMLIPVFARILLAKKPSTPTLVFPQRVTNQEKYAGLTWAMPSGLMTSAKFWDMHYVQQEIGFDNELWGNSNQIAETIQSFGIAGSRVLEVGGGGTNLSVILASSGFSVVSIDIAATITDQMSQHYPQQQWPNLTFVTADILSSHKSPPFQQGGFAIVVDKGGIHDLAMGPDAVARSFALPQKVVQKLTSQIKPSGGWLFLVSRYSHKVELGSGCHWEARSPVPIQSSGNAASFIHIAHCVQIPQAESVIPAPRGEEPLVFAQIDTPAVGYQTNTSFFLLANVLKDCMKAFLLAFRKCKPLRNVNSQDPEVTRLLKEVRMAFQFPMMQRHRLAQNVTPDVHAWLIRSRLGLQNADCPVVDECS
jgi:hypothetical protein